MTERHTAQEHLDYWIAVMNEPRIDGQSVPQVDRLHKQAKRELRYWRKQVRNQYEFTMRSIIVRPAMSDEDAARARREMQTFEGR